MIPVLSLNRHVMWNGSGGGVVRAVGAHACAVDVCDLWLANVSVGAARTPH